MNNKTLTFLLKIFGSLALISLGFYAGFNLKNDNSDNSGQNNNAKKPNFKSGISGKKKDTVFLKGQTIRDTVFVENDSNKEAEEYYDTLASENYEAMPFDSSSATLEEDNSEELEALDVSYEIYRTPQKEEIKNEIVLHTASLKAKIVYTDSLNKDSVLAKSAGIKIVNSKEFTIEFRKSPLNFKGYKMANKKIILYGIDWQNQKMNLFDLKDAYILNINEKYYFMTNSFEAKNYKLISEVEAKLLIQDFD